MSDESNSITRRTVLYGASLMSAGAVVGKLNAADAVAPSFVNLSASEANLLEAVVERLIPSDEHGPGAKEARVANYIDRALGDALKSSRQSYAAGLVALDKYAASSRGKPFLELSPIDRDSVLIDVETGGATGFTGSSAQFFAMLLNHVRQGMFGDPMYGGNVNFVGWDLLNYPGVRVAMPPDDQKALEANQLKFVRRSVSEMGFDHEHHGD